MKISSLFRKFQDFVWDYFIYPVADFFKIECEYCWWWRGVLFGSLLTSLFAIIYFWSAK